MSGNALTGSVLLGRAALIAKVASNWDEDAFFNLDQIVSLQG